MLVEFRLEFGEFPLEIDRLEGIVGPALQRLFPLQHDFRQFLGKASLHLTEIALEQIDDRIGKGDRLLRIENILFGEAVGRHVERHVADHLR